MIKTSIIGVTGFGDTHYTDLMREVAAGRVQAAGATIINQEEVPEKCEKLRQLGCPIFTDYREMLAACEADLCMIPTGIPLHRVMTVDALEAGLNVFVEKPAAGAVQDVDAMRAAAVRNGRFVAVGYQDMYADHTHIAKRKLLAGTIGRIRSIKVYGLWPRADSYYARNNWAGQLKVNGTWVLDSPMNNALAHEVIMSLFLAGASERGAACPVSVEAELYRAHEIESADTCCLRIQTDTGIPVTVWLTHASEANEGPVLEVQGEKGLLRRARRDAPVISSPETTEVLESKAPTRHTMMDAVLDRLQHGKRFVCDLDVARNQTLTINAAHEATRIHTIPDAYVRRQKEKGSVKTVVEGIDDVTKHAFEKGCLYSECDAPWAKEPGSFTLGDYTSFPQRPIG